jgi:6-methylsalicylate decarboxylase
MVEEKVSIVNTRESGKGAIPGNAAVDLHVHFLPQRYRQAAIDAGYQLADRLAPPGLPEWSAGRHVEVMDKLGIQTSVVSISSPGVQLYDDPDRVAALARLVNEEGAEAARRYPGRFRFFATLPLPDPDAALKELEFAFDELGAAGVVLLTNYRGTYPSDPSFAPVLAELSRRESVLFLHPTAPPCVCEGAMAGWALGMIEYFFESTRTVTDLILTRTLADNPGIRLVVAHAGAALPAIAARVSRNVRRRNASALDGSRLLPDFEQSLRSLWYDVSGNSLPYQLPALKQIVPLDRVVYGSDWPFANEELGLELRQALAATPELTDDERRAILRDNALQLLPAATGHP